MNENLEMPPRAQTQGQYTTERVFRTSMTTTDYLALEKECAERTTETEKMTPFKLSRLVLTFYIRRKLILLKDLPEHLQRAINEHYAN